MVSGEVSAASLSDLSALAASESTSISATRGDAEDPAEKRVEQERVEEPVKRGHAERADKEPTEERIEPEHVEGRIDQRHVERRHRATPGGPRGRARRARACRQAR